MLPVIKLAARQLRLSKASDEEKKQIKKNPIYIVVDNVLDTYNIGAIFRLADAVAAEKVLLCRGAETPPNHRIKKASINTTEWVAWEYFEDTKDAIKNLREHVPGIQIVAVEQAEQTVSYTDFHYHFPVALIVGHETDGVTQDVMDLCDAVVEMPMFGVNISLNVMVSLGIVLYEVIRQKELQSAT